MPLTIELRPSRRLYVVLALFHFIALLVALSLLTFGWAWLGVLLAPLILVSAIFYVRRDALLQSKNSITRIVWDAANVWHLYRYDGTPVDATLRGDAIVWPKALLLAFTAAGGDKYTVVLLQDSADAESLRLLRVRLRTRI